MIFGVWRFFPVRTSSKTGSFSDGISSGGVSCSNRAQPVIRGKTPLHHAAKEGHAAIVERFMAAGASEDAVDNEGRGLGAGRVDSDSTQVCRNFPRCEFTFLKIFTNFQGMTPYDLAKRESHAMVLGWLKPVPWRCSWKGMQFIHLGRVLSSCTCDYVLKLEDLLRVS